MLAKYEEYASNHNNVNQERTKKYYSSLQIRNGGDGGELPGPGYEREKVIYELRVRVLHLFHAETVVVTAKRIIWE